MGGGRWASPGLAFSDTERMQTSRHTTGRHQPTPEWVFSDRELAAVVLRFLEIRAGLWRKQPGSKKQRLASVVELLKERTAAQIKSLDVLCSQFVTCTDEERRRLLESEIANLDTQIRIAKEPWLIAECVRIYHRERADSKAVAARLRLRPPHVRQLLRRLNLLYARMQTGADVRIGAPSRKLHPLQPA